MTLGDGTPGGDVGAAGATGPSGARGVRDAMVHLKRLLVSALTCLAVGMAADAVHAADARSSPPPPAVLATTPYMGWNTYYGVGGVFDQRTIMSVADSLIHRGLARAGYRIVWLDFGWASGKRDRSGELIVDRSQWPNGLSWLTGWLHAHGLMAGIYTDAGKSGCYHQGVGSLGHYRQDADAFAAWGFDAVKVDFCGAARGASAPGPSIASSHARSGTTRATVRCC